LNLQQVNVEQILRMREKGEGKREVVNSRPRIREASVGREVESIFCNSDAREETR